MMMKLEKIFKTYLVVVLLVAFGLLQSGCAVVTALKQPEKKNLQVLNSGTSRENVIAYLGAPISSETDNGKTNDIYQFVQGYSGGTKTTRATIHVVMDIFTFFIWELVAWPAEVIFNGKKTTIKVTYDENRRVEDVSYSKQD